MSTLGLVLLISAVVLAVVLAMGLALVVGRRRAGVPSARAGRLARMGHLGARLSASAVGATLRRWLAPPERRAQLDEERRKADAALVARTMGEMKGALMKLGQMLSFVNEDLPAEYRAALASLQAQAPPMDFPLLRDVAERELGRPLERAYARFDDAPLASASIGQVHRAQLPDGREVVVKIQYPGVAAAIQADLDNAAVLYRFVGMMYPALDPKPVVDELRGRITEELDYAREAENQERFATRWAGHPAVHVPHVVRSHSSARVLTSELATGLRFAEAEKAPQELRNRWAEVLYRFVFSSIIRAGMFNGDPHPGNYLFKEDGGVTFLDFGCVKYFPAPMLRDWMELVRAHFTGDPAQFRERLVTLGFIKPEAPVAADLLYRYFGFFYEPFARDRVFTFTKDYTAKSLRMVFAPDGEFSGMTKHMNMPADFVFVNRIQWGIYSILTRLGATANFHRIHREYLYGEPPSTPLGEAEPKAAA
jgi:predicted unusual protein kinase regulating ubiquinone biosynthesis (AarF/ABC1/UbiB family)